MLSAQAHLNYIAAKTDFVAARLMPFRRKKRLDAVQEPFSHFIAPHDLLATTGNQLIPLQEVLQAILLIPFNTPTISWPKNA